MMNPSQPSYAPDDAAELPCAAGLLAATLTLMSSFAVPEPEVRVDAVTLRRLMARRIVANLFFLHQHPALPPGLRLVASRLHDRWQTLAPCEVTVMPADEESARLH